MSETTTSILIGMIITCLAVITKVPVSIGIWLGIIAIVICRVHFEVEAKVRKTKIKQILENEEYERQAYWQKHGLPPQ